MSRLLITVFVILLTGCSLVVFPPYNCFVTKYNGIDEHGKGYFFSGVRCEPGEIFRGPDPPTSDAKPFILPLAR